MRRAWIPTLVVAVGLANFSVAGFAQSTFDGTWTGSASTRDTFTGNPSSYEIRLTVANRKAHLILKCVGESTIEADFQLNDAGAFDIHIGGDSVRQRVSGQLPTIKVGSPNLFAPLCREATATLNVATEYVPVSPQSTAARTALPTVVPPASASPTTAPTPQPPTAEEEARRKFVASLRPDDMRQIQTALSFQGLYKSPIDGAWGPSTDAAIKAWQAKNDTPTTGILSSAQVDTLIRSASAVTPSPRAAIDQPTIPPQLTPSQRAASSPQQSATDQSERERQIAERERQLAEREKQLAEQKTAKERADRERQLAEQSTVQARAEEEARKRAAADKAEKDRQLDEREKQLAERERVLAEQERQLKSAMPPGVSQPPTSPAPLAAAVPPTLPSLPTATKAPAAPLQPVACQRPLTFVDRALCSTASVRKADADVIGAYQKAYEHYANDSDRELLTRDQQEWSDKRHVMCGMDKTPSAPLPTTKVERDRDLECFSNLYSMRLLWLTGIAHMQAMPGSTSMPPLDLTRDIGGTYRAGGGYWDGELKIGGRENDWSVQISTRSSPMYNAGACGLDGQLKVIGSAALVLKAQSPIDKSECKFDVTTIPGGLRIEDKFDSEACRTGGFGFCGARASFSGNYYRFSSAQVASSPPSVIPQPPAPPPAKPARVEWGQFIGLWVPHSQDPTACSPKAMGIPSDMYLQIEQKAVSGFEWHCDITNLARSSDVAFNARMRCPEHGNPTSVTQSSAVFQLTNGRLSYKGTAYMRCGRRLGP